VNLVPGGITEQPYSLGILVRGIDPSGWVHLELRQEIMDTKMIALAKVVVVVRRGRTDQETRISDSNKKFGLGPHVDARHPDRPAD
jgi:hypothetical protein